MDRLDRTMWFIILLLSVLPLICSFMQMEFMKKSTGLISVCLSLPLYLFSTILPCIVGYVLPKLESDPAFRNLFRGYKRTGKIIGALLLSFGNVGLDYFTEKSVACMLTFLFLAVYFLSILCCIQPCTDFGILELLLSASSIVALRRFGVLHFNSWLVVLACLLIDVIRYLLDPESGEHQPPVTVEAPEQISGLSHRIEVASTGTEEYQLSMTETSNGTEENPLSTAVQGVSTDSLAGEETIPGITTHRRTEEIPPATVFSLSIPLERLRRIGLCRPKLRLRRIRLCRPKLRLRRIRLCRPKLVMPLSKWEENEEDQEIANVWEEIANAWEEIDLQETEEDQEIANAGEETEEHQVSMTETANAGEETLPSIRNPNIGGDGPIRAPIQASRLRKRRVLPGTNQFK